MKQVLNESHWPISGTQKFPLLLDKQLLQCQQKFQEYYDKTTEKRRLQWLYNYGTVTIAGRFTNSKLPIQLVLTPLQVIIFYIYLFLYYFLLLFYQFFYYFNFIMIFLFNNSIIFIFKYK